MKNEHEHQQNSFQVKDRMLRSNQRLPLDGLNDKSSPTINREDRIRTYELWVTSLAPYSLILNEESHSLKLSW
jgi:hypothetical protein